MAFYKKLRPFYLNGIEEKNISIKEKKCEKILLILQLDLKAKLHSLSIYKFEFVGISGMIYLHAAFVANFVMATK